MPLRFRPRIRLARGIRLNFRKDGSTSLTLGRGPAHITISDKGVRETVSLPGTGLSYSEFKPAGTRNLAQNVVASSQAKRPGAGIFWTLAAIAVVVIAAWLFGR